MEENVFPSVIPVSDSGEAGANTAFEHLRSSLIRGFVPAALSKQPAFPN